MIRSHLSVALTVLSLAAPASGEGALAVGSTSDITKDGVAFGTAVNYTTSSEARESALEKCRSYKPAPKAAAQCQIVGAFRRECWAIAMDPKPATPGAGWAIAGTKAVAEERALENCKTTAGAARRSFCRVEESNCDEN